MEKKDIVIPAAGESVTEGEIVEWAIEDGSVVAMDDVLFEIETEKASMELRAEAAGTVKILVEEGVVTVGQVVGHILVGEGAGDASAAPTGSSEAETSAATSGNTSGDQAGAGTASSGAGSSAAGASTAEASTASSTGANAQQQTYATGTPSVAAGKLMRENNISSVEGTGKDGRITKQDVVSAIQKGGASSGSGSAGSSAGAGSAAGTSGSQAAAPGSKAPVQTPGMGGERKEERKRMSLLRRTIAKRLTEAQQSAALLTTFNEIDMKPVMDIRKQYKDGFKDTHGIGLGFMSFFTKAVVEALKAYPLVNSQIDGDEIVTPNFCDIGIAVSTPKGLVVPIVRNAESKSFSQIESDIREYALRGRDGKLTMDDMEGGTFTITNGGVFGSMLSTPIVNRPQSGILGMHNIVQRPVAVNGEVVIRPVMYVALTYDHRIIDGAEAVGFLVKIKECIEDPVRMLLHV